jgi:hypothetical protein
VAALDLDEQGNFVTLRQDVREALAAGSCAHEVADAGVSLSAALRPP